MNVIRTGYYFTLDKAEAASKKIKSTKEETMSDKRKQKQKQQQWRKHQRKRKQKPQRKH